MIDLKSEVARLTNELEQMSKIVKMMNPSTETLDQILSAGKPAHDVQGLGYSGKGKSTQTVFITSQGPNQKPGETSSSNRKNEPQTSGQTSPSSATTTWHSASSQRSRQSTPKHNWICHYCGRKGHIQPFCYRLYGKNYSTQEKDKHVWRAKRVNPTARERSSRMENKR